MSVIKEAARDLKENTTTPRRLLVVVVGVVLVLIGIIGTFIPLFPGRTTMIAGLVLLSIYSPSVHAWVKRKTQNHPRLQSYADRMRNKVINLIHPSR